MYSLIHKKVHTNADTDTLLEGHSKGHGFNCIHSMVQTAGFKTNNIMVLRHCDNSPYQNHFKDHEVFTCWRGIVEDSREGKTAVLWMLTLPHMERGGLDTTVLMVGDTNRPSTVQIRLFCHCVFMSYAVTVCLLF